MEVVSVHCQNCSQVLNKVNLTRKKILWLQYFFKISSVISSMYIEVEETLQWKLLHSKIGR